MRGRDSMCSLLRATCAALSGLALNAVALATAPPPSAARVDMTVAAPSAPSPAPDLAALAAHAAWRGLLHVPPDQTRSEVLSPEFFQSTTAPGEPLAELQAALHAWHQPWPEDGTPHARCRFPARYFWLAQQGLLPGYVAREPRCTSLERWAQFDRLRSVSLLLVSGYLGNPASNFGHSLMRLNTDDADGVRALLDVGINFGALIPEDEMVPVYIVKGLTGGYLSGYSDKYFYTHDLVYTRTEARDLWDYELALSDDERTWLAMHLYEMVGRQFRYFFLHRNCAWRLAQAVELVTGRTLTQRGSVWYTPIELFHRLKLADAAGPTPLIARVRYVPSSERQFRHAFTQLAPGERALVNLAMRLPPEDLPGQLRPALQALPADRRGPVLEALLRHGQLLEVAEEPEVQPATRERMAQLLRLRLAEPPAETDPPPPPPRPSAADANPPATLGLGLLHTAAAADGRPAVTRWLLRGAAYDHHGLDEHGLDRGELVVLDFALAGDHRGRSRVEQLDVMRVRKIDTSTVAIEGFDRWSWHIVIGARRHGHVHGDALRAQVSYAAGKAWALGPRAAAWLMLDSGVLADPGTALLAPRLGMQAEHGAWAVALDTAWRNEWRLHGRAAPGADRRAALWTHQLSARWREPGQRLDLRLGWSRDTRTRTWLAASGSW
jgi:hypothetical protein